MSIKDALNNSCAFEQKTCSRMTPRRAVATCRSLRRDRPLKIQRKNSGSGNKCLRAIGTTT